MKRGHHHYKSVQRGGKRDFTPAEKKNHTRDGQLPECSSDRQQVPADAANMTFQFAPTLWPGTNIT